MKKVIRFLQGGLFRLFVSGVIRGLYSDGLFLDARNIKALYRLTAEANGHLRAWRQVMESNRGSETVAEMEAELGKLVLAQR